jgi:hypothetical protein
MLILMPWIVKYFAMPDLVGGAGSAEQSIPVARLSRRAD